MSGQVRIQTRDAMVVVSEFVPGEGDDWDQSIRYYGPFESADEQRAFMRSVIEEAPIDDGYRAQMREAIDQWRRFDEEEQPDER